LADKTTTDTLNIGDKAPDFTLSAANRPGTVSLSEFLQRGPAIVEFLRGTW
jgi:peroxiredoxin